MIELTNEAEFDFGSAEYRAFFARFGLSPFQHPDWLQPFYRRLPVAAGQKPLIVVGREARTGELRCVVPLLLDDTGARRRVTFAFLEVTDYACPVVDPETLGELAFSGVLDRLVGDHTLEIAPVHHDHRATWSQLLGRPAEPLHFGSHAVAVQPAEGRRRRSYGPNQLSGLRRKARRLAELGDLRLDPVTGGAARAAIETARALRVGRFPGDPLEVDPSAAFYGDVAASMDGLARTFRLMCGENVVAVTFGLVHGRRFHYLILACDYPNYARYSPGLLIMDMAIEAWAEGGGDVFDFTIGDELFKADFGCSRTPMYSIRA